jgi:hypothetical protein
LYQTVKHGKGCANPANDERWQLQISQEPEAYAAHVMRLFCGTSRGGLEPSRLSGATLSMRAQRARAAFS